MTRPPGAPGPWRSRRGSARASLSALPLVLIASTARADPPPGDGAPATVAPAETEEVSPGLRGPRLGVTAGIGIGFAGFTGNVAFPSFVFTTAIQLEVLLELTRWGFFLRGGFLSSGASGRWTAPTLALGSQYRLVGDGEERWGLVVRAGGIYERWTATPTVGSCDVLYVIPNSCQNYAVPPPASGVPVAPSPSPITAESFGLLAGLRLEVPVEPVYVAFDAELSAAKDVDRSAPGGAITGQLVFTFALRDHARWRGSQRFVPPMRYR